MHRMRLKSLLKENRGLLVFIVLLVCFRSAIADWNYVPTGSMEPTILPGDEVQLLENRLLINGQPANYLQPETGLDVLIANEQLGDLNHPVQYGREFLSPLRNFDPGNVPENYP